MASASDDLSRRERQIMNVLYGIGRATAEQVRTGMADALSNSAVRTMLRSLERKGHVKHEQDGPRYVFMPTVEARTARQGALQQVLQVFFKGSTEQAFAALLDLKASDLTEDDYNRMAELIDRARRKGT